MENCICGLTPAASTVEWHPPDDCWISNTEHFHMTCACGFQRARGVFSKARGRQLSVREREVLQCASRGMKNLEIGAELGITEQTVKNHMSSILRKLNVPDRTAAVVTAIRFGWITT